VWTPLGTECDFTFCRFCGSLYIAVSNSGCIALSVTVTDDELEKTWKEVTKS